MATQFKELHLAAERGDLADVMRLIAISNVKAKNKEGKTALMLAVAGRFGFDRKAECLAALIPFSDPKTSDCGGMTALMHAAVSLNRNAVNALLPVSDLDAQDCRGWTALMHAAECGHIKGLEVLLRVCDASAKDFDGETALMKAAYRGHLDCVAALLPFSDAKTKDRNGETALMIAADKGHVDCIKILIPVSDVTAMNIYGETARDMARWTDEAYKLVDKEVARRESEERDTQAAVATQTIANQAATIAALRAEIAELKSTFAAWRSESQDAIEAGDADNARLAMIA